jgi:SpoVK/Ycf46/Vps4 family AAA+-type ATPase
MRKTNKTEIKTAYDNARFDLDSLMNLMEMELAKPQDNPDWGHVGSMRHVRQELLELVSHLTGRSINTLREALEEIREDAQILNEQNNA